MTVQVNIDEGNVQVIDDQDAPILKDVVELGPSIQAVREEELSYDNGIETYRAKGLRRVEVDEFQYISSKTKAIEPDEKTVDDLASRLGDMDFDRS